MIYQAPELKFILLDQTDVIATSGLLSGLTDGGEMTDPNQEKMKTMSELSFS